LSSLVGIEQRIKLQLNDKISLKLDSNSNWLLEYGWKSLLWIAAQR